jgi:hypothetical protein
VRLWRSPLAGSIYISAISSQSPHRSITPQLLESIKFQAHRLTQKRNVPWNDNLRLHVELTLHITNHDVVTMRFIATTAIACATLALATPAPIGAAAVPESLPEFRHALLSRDATLSQLVTRASSSKPKGSNGGSSSNSSAAVSVSQSNVLVMGALGLGVMEVVRLLN